MAACRQQHAYASRAEPAGKVTGKDGIPLGTDSAAQAAGARERFRVIEPSEWSKPSPPMLWDVRGIWPRGSFGPLAGEKKSLKTYAAMAISLALASGEPAFGCSEFTVPRARPVIYFSGEGGRRNAQSRLQRIARAYGVDELADVPLYLVCDAAPINGSVFLDAMDRICDEYQPGMIVLDPLYAFHPAGVDAGNLYERGRMLAELSARTVEAGTSLIVPDHFRKTGAKDLDLDSISQAGMGAWADTWILQSHSQRPNVEQGEFKLAVEFGSREGYGRRWEIDWSIGAFNNDSGDHTGAIAWNVRPSGGESGSEDKRARLEAVVLQILRDQPWELTRTALEAAVGGNHGFARAAIDHLVALGVIGVKEMTRVEGRGGVQRKRDLFGIAGDGKVHRLPSRPKRGAGSGGMEVR